MKSDERCPVCGAYVGGDRHDWLRRCTSCGYLKAVLEVRTTSATAQQAINEDKRMDGLREIRRANFKRILDRLEIACPGKSGRRLLDVGCAHGWFLDAARERGFEVFGIEPDQVIGGLARQHGLTVWDGHFPEDVPDGKTFDVISFNDVFEHLPNPEETLTACWNLLAPGGLLVINLPCSHGIFYRLADFFDRFGFSGPFERMWQKNFASPHLLYLTQEQMDRLAARFGFAVCHKSSLPSVELKGLWARLRYDRKSSMAASLVTWLAVVGASPFLRLLPADILLAVYVKAEPVSD